MLKKLKQYKIAVGYLVVIVTILVFARFISVHPEVWWQLKATKASTIVLVIMLYAVMTTILAVLYKVMAMSSRAVISGKDNFLLTMYSSVVNFFGPLQSGPGFRTIYLRKKYNINIATYIGLTLVYYFCFGTFSGLFLLSGVFGLWLVPLLLFGLLVIYASLPKILKMTVVRKYIPKSLPLNAMTTILYMTFFQAVVVALIYYTELRSIQTGISFSQAVIYSGAANFSLFVSLTPGALGFRESFLYFSRDLHHITESTIVSANILDRAVYLLFLGMLVVIILVLHGHTKFKPVKDIS